MRCEYLTAFLNFVWRHPKSALLKLSREGSIQRRRFHEADINSGANLHGICLVLSRLYLNPGCYLVASS